MWNAIPSGFLNIVLYSIPRNPNLIIEALVILQSQILEKTTGSQGGGADFMKQLMGPSADDKSTLQSRYCDVQLPEDCFRIFAVQELEKLHRSLDGIQDASRTHVPAKLGRNENPMPIGKFFDVDSRAILKRRQASTCRGGGRRVLQVEVVLRLVPSSCGWKDSTLVVGC